MGTAFISRRGGSKAEGLPSFTYTGNYTLADQGDNNWKMTCLSSGTLTFQQVYGNLQVFLVGGGGSSPGGGGGGGGYTTTSVFTPQKNTGYAIVVGASGGTTTGFGFTAGAGQSGEGYPSNKGGDGGSGGGSFRGYGGQDGGNGTAVNYPCGVGQGSTTREFGEATGTLYATGGNGGCDNNTAHPSFAANTGHGGHGGGDYSTGASGVVLIRNQR